ncbi:PepSY domain-containing protein [Marivibrio halodurans]|uniref:PepSY domain-containing protein n=1 Tax=Marivibrio halodurans TaxID=2039722 RepID=A0A8J7S2E8_9PROT|nr:PepSY-associated TM helix domain-containing protein [Marivibrio halodurans]MBP5857323.1 PepSY domain-containing protein [Marivibrio halodurans]
MMSSRTTTTPTMKRRPRRKADALPARTRRFLADLHLWIGVGFCIPFILLGVSGSYLVYHESFDALLAGGGSVTATDGPPRPAGEIVAAALAAAPDGAAATLLFMPDAPGEAARVRVGPADANFRDPRMVDMAIDPATLAILDDGDGGGGGRSALTTLMHRIHGHALIGGAGRPVIGWLGVGMVILGISGLVIWWPKRGQWRQALTIKRGARGLRLHRDLHGAVGFWSLIVFMVVSVTGVYIAFPRTLTAAVSAVTSGSVESTSPLAPPLTPIEAVEGAPPLDLGRLAESAQAAVPEGRLWRAMAPFRPGQPTRAWLALPGAADGAPSVTVSLDPWTADVLAIEDPRRFDAARTIEAWQRPLHEGRGLGPVWRALVFVSGLLPLLFAITGVSMWLIKRARRKRFKAGG